MICNDHERHGFLTLRIPFPFLFSVSANHNQPIIDQRWQDTPPVWGEYTILFGRIPTIPPLLPTLGRSIIHIYIYIYIHCRGWRYPHIYICIPLMGLFSPHPPPSYHSHSHNQSINQSVS